MADYYATLPDDTIILIPYEDEPTFTNYYDLDQEIIFSLDELRDRDAARVELLTWFQVPADLDGQMSCTLGATATRSLEQFEVKGLTTNGFELPVAEGIGEFSLVMYPDVHFYRSALIENMEYKASEYAVCISSSWVGVRGDAYGQHVVKLASQLIDPFGMEISRAEGLIVSTDLGELFRWPAYNLSKANNLLTLPEGLPPGEYDVLIRLYSPENPSGFDVIDSETGESLGKDLRITVEIPGNPYDNPPENPALLRDNTEDGAIHSGLRLELELQNSFSEETTLILEGDDWQVEETIAAGPSLAWAALQIPPDAEGEARLTFGENELAVYNIIKTERIFDEPESALQVDAAFGEIAVLRGASIEQTAHEIRVELVWQAIETPSDDYVVFVQVLDANGALLAQSDTQPVNGERPTSSWIADEYITDSHTVNLDALNYEGQGTIIVGMYHAITRARVPLADGEDFVPLPTEVMIE
jgi:hypothetical protein